MRRLAVFVGALLVALLLAEGALSLVARHSLRELLGAPRPRAGPTPAARAGLAANAGAGTAASTTPSTTANTAANTGAPLDAPADDATLDDAIFALHEDPLVGYVLKRDADLAIYSGHIRTDHLGLRRQPGPPPPEDALRIVVLGDSIAFGFGVDDDQCLAARLEADLAQMRGPGERPIACRTVAVPSWNHRAAPAFLFDHWDELRPDLVLYLPCRNDVCDTDSASTAGQRRVVPDPASDDPWLSVSVRTLVQNDSRRLLQSQGGDLSEEDLGQDALFSDVCAESRKRHDASAASLAGMFARVTQRGARFAIVWNNLSEYTWFLSSRLARLAPELPAIVMFDRPRQEFSLGFDPHPNAQTLDVWARWLATELVARGWVSRGSNVALPPVPEEYEQRRGHMPAASEFESLAAEAHARAQKLLRPDIDFRRRLGLFQVLGGLNPSGSAREHLMVVLAPTGKFLELELEPLAARLDLYPLDVAVSVNGTPLGTVTIRPDALLQARLPLPESLDRSIPLEVRLVPERWIVRNADPAPGAASPQSMSVDCFRPKRIACTP